MSALAPKTDICQLSQRGRYLPIGDIASVNLRVIARASLICCGDRQSNFKNAAVGVRLGQPQTTTVVLDDGLTDRKPQTHAGLLRRKERLEYASGAFCGYPRSCILNGKQNGLFVVARRQAQTPRSRMFRTHRVDCVPC